MKKITDKQVQTALLRGAVIVTGSTCTAVTALFFNSIYAIVTVCFLGAGITALIDETINVQNRIK